MRQGLLTKRTIFGSGFRPMATELAKVTGDGFVKVENGILKCRSNANNETAYAFFPLTVGLEGYVEVCFEAKRVSGSTVDFNQAGGVGFNRYDAPQAVTGIGGNLPDWTKIMSSEWKPYRFVVPSDIAKGFMAIMVGCFANSIGEYWFRRFEVNVYNHALVSPDARICKILKSGSGWSVDRKPDGSSNIGCYRLEVLSGYLKVHYDAINSWGDPIVVCSIEATGGKGGWSAQPSSITRNNCVVALYNAAGTVQTPSSVDSININVMVLGG